MWRKAILVVMLVGFTTVAVSCGGGDGDGSPTAPSTVFQGTFSLESVTSTDNGVTVTFTPPTVTGSVTVMPDGTYSATMHWPEAGIINDAWTGTWTRNGNQLTVIDEDGTPLSGTLSEDWNQFTLIVTVEGATAIFTYLRV